MSDTKVTPETELQELERELEQARQLQEQANARILELHNKQRELSRKREEEARLEELSRPREVRVRAFDGTNLTLAVLPTIRDDILGVFKSARGRTYDAYTQTNRIHVDTWPIVRDQLLALPNVKVTHLVGVAEAIDKFLVGPEFLIKQQEKFILIEHHVRAITGVLQGIPGLRWLDKGASIPLSEGWRLIEIFENYTRQNEKKQIVWVGNLLETVQEELERRVALDKLATQEDTELVSPFTVGHELRPFQKVGVRFIQLSKGRSLLADQMGLGKTWQALAYALLHGHRTVIICPAHLKANWAREIYNLTGQFPYILKGREPDQFAITTMLIDKPQFCIINYDILGYKTVEPESIRENADGTRTHIPPKDRFLWSEMISMSRPDLVVLDEAHYIKNTSANRTKAILAIQPEYRLPMTGTPVLNRVGEFFSALHWIRPDLFPSEERFMRDYTVDGKAPKNVPALRELLKPIMIRRLTKDVVKDLPPLTRITQSYELTDAAQARYDLVLKGVYRAIDAAGNEIEKNVTSILVEIGKLKAVCADDMVQNTVDLARELYDSTEEGEAHRKVLIFSQFKDPVHKIAHQLGESCLSWTGDTSMDRRTELEKKFQTDPKIKYLVISLMTGQTGLNLTAAGHVIFNDLYWTPAAHAQAEQRAYGRLADLHGASSYYMMMVGTIMEWIQDMIGSKLAVINETVEGINQERDISAAMSVIAKLKEARYLNKGK